MNKDASQHVIEFNDIEESLIGLEKRNHLEKEYNKNIDQISDSKSYETISGKEYKQKYWSHIQYALQMFNHR